MSRMLWWPSDGSDEFFHPVDGRLGVELLKYAYGNANGSALNFLEVGVWKGAWSSVILKNLAGATGYGIDPYPGRPDFEQKLISRLETIGVADRFSLFASWDEFSQRFTESGGLFAIHIDGEHSEDAVLVDLRKAAEYLAERGVIIVDDYRHFWFPGITSALYRFIHESDFRMLAASDNKAYLVRSRFHAEIQNGFRPVIEDALKMRVWTSWGEWDPNLSYSQSSEVSQHSVLLVPPVPVKVQLSPTSSILTSSPASELRKILGEWIPPVVGRMFKRILSGRRSRNPL